MIGHDGNTNGETACLRLVPERNVAWALLMNLSGQNWAAMELAQRADRPVDRDDHARPARAHGRSRCRHADRLVGVYQSIGSRLTVSADGDDLVLDIEHLEAPDGTPAMRGELLPVDGERFMLRAPALGDDLPLTFMARRRRRDLQYLHMGARLYRRTA